MLGILSTLIVLSAIEEAATTDYTLVSCAVPSGVCLMDSNGFWIEVTHADLVEAGYYNQPEVISYNTGYTYEKVVVSDGYGWTVSESQDVWTTY